MWKGIEGMLASGHCRLLEVGNPTDTEVPYAKHFSTDKYNKINISCWEAPNVQTAKWGHKGRVMVLEDFQQGKDPDELLEPGHNLPEYPGMVAWDWPWNCLQEWGAQSFDYQVKVKGRFSDIGEDLMINISMIDQCRDLELLPLEDDKKVLAIDPARFGSDTTGYCHRWGPKANRIWERHGDDTSQTASRAVYEIKHNGMEVDEIRVDCDGLGAGTMDRLTEFKEAGDLPGHIELVEIHSSGPAWDKNGKYYDRRSEMWGSVAEQMKEAEIDLSTIDNKEFERELRGGSKYKYTGGKVKIFQKEDIKGVMGKSPNMADAFIYAFLPEVQRGLRELVWM
jgi:hypothetical protein